QKKYIKKTSFKKWLKEWIRYLIPKSKGLQREIFNICNVVINDTSIALFILPYIVANIIKYGNLKDRQEIKQEIMDILTQKPQSSKHIQTIFILIELLGKWSEK